MNKNEKKSIVGNVICVVLFGVMVVVYLLTQSNVMFCTNPQDLMDLIEEDGEPTKGEYVKVNVDAVVDWYAETEHKINGFIPAGKEWHCILWLEDGSFISMTVKGKKTYELVEEIMQDTWTSLDLQADYLHTPVVFKGRISSISPEVRDYYDDALSYAGISEYDGYKIYYVDINTTTNTLSAWLMFLGVVAIEVGAVLLLIKEIKHNKQIKAMPEVSTAYTDNTLDPIFGNMYKSTEGIGEQSTASMTDDDNTLYK